MKNTSEEASDLIEQIRPLLPRYSRGAVLIALMNTLVLVLRQLDESTRDDIIDTLPVALREILEPSPKPPN